MNFDPSSVSVMNRIETLGPGRVVIDPKFLILRLVALFLDDDRRNNAIHIVSRTIFCTKQPPDAGNVEWAEILKVTSNFELNSSLSV